MEVEAMEVGGRGDEVGEWVGGRGDGGRPAPAPVQLLSKVDNTGQ